MASFHVPFDAISHQLDSSLCTFSQGSIGPFVQVLDESMVVIREDITDWLQRYLFRECGVPPLENAKDLLERLKSGVWLGRLAYKIHFKVIAASNSSTAIPPSGKPQRGAGLKVTSKDHRLYASLRGTGPSGALGNLTPDTLPPFRRPLRTAAEAPIGRLEKRSNFAASSGIADNIATQWAARANISAFLEWCHDLGISATVLFETTGLVNRTEEKNVLLTLMDLARLASRYGLCDLPELVKMEREIEVLEARRLQSGVLTIKDENKDKTVFPRSSNNLVQRTKKEQPQVDPQEYAIRVAERRQSAVEQAEQKDDTSESSLISSAVTLGDVNSDILDNNGDCSIPIHKSYTSLNWDKAKSSPDSSLYQITPVSLTLDSDSIQAVSKTHQTISIKQRNNTQVSACGDVDSVDPIHSSLSLTVRDKQPDNTKSIAMSVRSSKQTTCDSPAKNISTETCVKDPTTPTLFSTPTQANSSVNKLDVSSISTCMNGNISTESDCGSSKAELIIASIATPYWSNALTKTDRNGNAIDNTYMSDGSSTVTCAPHVHPIETDNYPPVSYNSTGCNANKRAKLIIASVETPRWPLTATDATYACNFQSETTKPQSKACGSNDNENSAFTISSCATSTWLSTPSSHNGNDEQTNDTHITSLNSEFSDTPEKPKEADCESSLQHTLTEKSANDIVKLEMSSVTSLSKSPTNTFSEDTLISSATIGSGGISDKSSNKSKVISSKNITEVAVDVEGSIKRTAGKENAPRIESANRFGWQSHKRTSSTVDLRSQVDPWRGYPRPRLDNDSSDNSPHHPMPRSQSQSNLSPQHKGFNSCIPVSSTLQRPRSQSKGRCLRDMGQPRQPSPTPKRNTSQSKNSSGFASRSSSYSDVHVEVKKQVAKCTCCNRIKLQRLDEGRYQLGSRVYYLRRFRAHIMVRVGGGWLTLSEFLARYDPCRQKQGQLSQTSALRDGLLVPAAELLESWPSDGPNDMFYATKFHKGPGPCR